MKEMAKLSNIKDIEDLVEIEKHRGEDLEECKDNSDIWGFVIIFENIWG